MKKSSFYVAACLAVLGASSAQAVNISVSKVAVNTSPYSVQYNGKAIFAGPIDLTIANTGPVVASLVPKTLRVWCIDLQHEITLGNKNPTLTFKVTTLEDYFPTYTNMQLDQLAWLIHEGSTKDPFIRKDNMISEAIWEFLEPGAVTGPTAALQMYAKNLATSGNTFDHTRIRVYDGLGVVQSQAGMVPEPAAWAMLIGGFGLIGGAMRQRTRRSFQSVTC